jgi:hypothetical protein
VEQGGRECQPNIRIQKRVGLNANFAHEPTSSLKLKFNAEPNPAACEVGARTPLESNPSSKDGAMNDADDISQRERRKLIEERRLKGASKNSSCR